MSASIAQNLQTLQQQIHDAASQASRSVEDIQLIAVSKNHPASVVQEAFEHGQLHFGENRIQEAVPKTQELSSDIQWHLIGHLQRNKAVQVPGHFQWFHALDSLRLFQELEKRCEVAQTSLNVLAQVNIFEEASKGGIASWDALQELVDALQTASRLQLKGLMCMAPQGASETEIRQGFAKTRLWCEKLKQQWQLPECKELSMGMSNDFHWAIAEGATFIRVGRAIFGERR